MTRLLFAALAALTALGCRKTSTRANSVQAPDSRRAPGNLDDDAYARMRASAGLPPEKKRP